jgi:hypothetical protein
MVFFARLRVATLLLPLLSVPLPLLLYVIPSLP